jgi:hypothetical protein
MSSEERVKRGLAGRDWVQSDEASMSARKMCETFISTTNETISNFKKRNRFELIKTEKLSRKKISHPLIY